jgi:hypothetical protein
MFLLSLLLALITLPLLLPTLADLVALTRGWPRARRHLALLPYDPPRLLFLVPAHD